MRKTLATTYSIQRAFIRLQTNQLTAIGFPLPSVIRSKEDVRQNQSLHDALHCYYVAAGLFLFSASMLVMSPKRRATAVFDGKGASLIWCVNGNALCEAAPLSDRPISTPPESYIRMVRKGLKITDAKEEQKPDEAKHVDDAIYGELEDANLLWALNSKQIDRMGISQINANEQLEDRAVLQEIHTVCNGSLMLAGVMDGHGGWQVADYVQRKIGAYIERSINKMAASTGDCTKPLSDEDLAKAMKDAFITLDGVIKTKIKGTCDLGLSRTSRVGACCVVALITDSSIIVANAGDCRAVVDHNGTALPLSEPHSANEEKERERLRAEHPGEDDIVVCKNTYQTVRQPSAWFDYPRHWLGFLGNEIRLSGCYVKGRLQPTRSFGDFYLKEKSFSYDFESKRPFLKTGDSFPYITAEPTTRILQRTKGTGDFILLASDGVWDFLSNDEAIQVARTSIKVSPQTAAANVIQSVLRKAAAEAKISIADIVTIPQHQKRRIFDDTTVCIVKLDEV